MRLHRYRSLPALVLSGLLLGALAGCEEESSTSTAAESPSPTPLEVRAVIATSQAPAPDSSVKQQFDALDCDAGPVPVPVDEPGAACDAAGTKYSLGPAVVVGGVEDAQAGVAPGPDDTWVITVELEAGASDALRELSSELVGTGGRLALLAGGVVVSAPTVEAPITDGRLQVAGDYDEESATALAEAISPG